jgi:hypothetical protein
MVPTLNYENYYKTGINSSNWWGAIDETVIFHKFWPKNPVNKCINRQVN